MSKIEEVYPDLWKKLHLVMKSEGSTFSLYENLDFGGLYWGKVNDSSPGFSSTPFIGAEFSMKKKRIRVNVYIPNDINFFEGLEDEKDNLEEIIGKKLEWKTDCGKHNVRRIIKDIEGFDYKNKQKHFEYIKEMITLIERFIVAFDSKLQPYRMG